MKPRYRHYTRALTCFAVAMGILASASACGGDLSCEEATKAVNEAESARQDYEGDSLDREQELREQVRYAEGDARRVCAL